MENIIVNKNWVRFGLLWGTFMFFTISIIFPLLENVPLEPVRLFKSLAVWLIMGLVFGYTMKLIERRKD